MASASNAIDIWDDIMKYAQTLERRIQELEKELKDKEDKIKSLSQNSSSSSGASTTSSSGINAISSSDAIAVTATAADLPPFNLKKHLEYIMSLNHAKKMDDNNDGKEITFESVATDHLKMQGVFWAVGSLSILGKFDQVKNAKEIQQITDWVMECYHPESGGFGGNVLHDPHLLHTQHAIYVLALCGTLSRLTDDNEKKEKVIGYIVSRQLPDGSFAGDQWGEVDIRFSYCAFISLRILDALDRIDLQKAMEYIVSCQNFDGGFGCAKGVESHAGYIFTAVAALSVGGGLELVSKSVWDRLSWWLCERQCDSGGLNGRPEKQADVCYSWWVLSSLSIMKHINWINSDKLVQFILECQDSEQGGIGDRPGNVGDVYHTFFGICGLSLLGYFDKNKVEGIDHKAVDPTYALPKELLVKLGIY